jgi:hypothetical protein
MTPTRNAIGNVKATATTRTPTVTTTVTVIVPTMPPLLTTTLPVPTATPPQPTTTPPQPTTTTNSNSNNTVATTIYVGSQDEYNETDTDQTPHLDEKNQFFR